MRNNWEEEIYQKPKLLHMSHLNLPLNPSHMYTHIIMSRSERSLFAQLRIRLLPLKIENWRYNKVKVVRICELCHLDIEDENHFVHAQYMLIIIREEILSVPNHTKFNDRYDNLLVFWTKYTQSGRNWANLSRKLGW